MQKLISNLRWLIVVCLVLPCLACGPDGESLLKPMLNIISVLSSELETGSLKSKGEHPNGYFSTRYLNRSKDRAELTLLGQEVEPTFRPTEIDMKHTVFDFSSNSKRLQNETKTLLKRLRSLKWKKREDESLKEVTLIVGGKKYLLSFTGTQIFPWVEGLSQDDWETYRQDHLKIHETIYRSFDHSEDIAFLENFGLDSIRTMDHLILPAINEILFERLFLEDEEINEKFRFSIIDFGQNRRLILKTTQFFEQKAKNAQFLRNWLKEVKLKRGSKGSQEQLDLAKSMIYLSSVVHGFGASEKDRSQYFLSYFKKLYSNEKSVSRKRVSFYDFVWGQFYYVVQYGDLMIRALIAEYDLYDGKDLYQNMVGFLSSYILALAHFVDEGIDQAEPNLFELKARLKNDYHFGTHSIKLENRIHRRALDQNRLKDVQLKDLLDEKRRVNPLESFVQIDSKDGVLSTFRNFIRGQSSLYLQRYTRGKVLSLLHEKEPKFTSSLHSLKSSFKRAGDWAAEINTSEIKNRIRLLKQAKTDELNTGVEIKGLFLENRKKISNFIDAYSRSKNQFDHLKLTQNEVWLRRYDLIDQYFPHDYLESDLSIRKIKYEPELTSKMTSLSLNQEEGSEDEVILEALDEVMAEEEVEKEKIQKTFRKTLRGDFAGTSSQSKTSVQANAHLEAFESSSETSIPTKRSEESAARLKLLPDLQKFSELRRRIEAQPHIYPIVCSELKSIQKKIKTELYNTNSSELSEDDLLNFSVLVFRSDARFIERIDKISRLIQERAENSLRLMRENSLRFGQFFSSSARARNQRLDPVRDSIYFEPHEPTDRQGEIFLELQSQHPYFILSLAKKILGQAWLDSLESLYNQYVPLGLVSSAVDSNEDGEFSSQQSQIIEEFLKFKERLISALEILQKNLVENVAQLSQFTTGVRDSNQSKYSSFYGLSPIGMTHQLNAFYPGGVLNLYGSSSTLISIQYKSSFLLGRNQTRAQSVYFNELNPLHEKYRQLMSRLSDRRCEEKVEVYRELNELLVNYYLKDSKESSRMGNPLKFFRAEGAITDVGYVKKSDIDYTFYSNAIGLFLRSYYFVDAEVNRYRYEGYPNVIFMNSPYVLPFLPKRDEVSPFETNALYPQLASHHQVFFVDIKNLIEKWNESHPDLPPIELNFFFDNRGSSPSPNAKEGFDYYLRMQLPFAEYVSGYSEPVQ